MATPVRFAALQIPLRGGWVLDLRRKGLTTPCVAVAGLPAGWTGYGDASGPIGWKHVQRGPAVTLAETVPLEWEVFHPEGSDSGSRLEVIADGLFRRNSREGTNPRGDFLSVNHLGLTGLTVRLGGVEERLAFEVVSTKFGHERDFERMTSDIAKHCQQLLLEWNTPAGLPFTTDSERRNRLLLEQFLYLSDALGSGRLERWMESIRNHPHSCLERESRWIPAHLARGTDFLRRPLAFARTWRMEENSYLPGEVLDVVKRDNRDTPPNRFLRHALEDFDRICRDVIRAFPPDGGPARTGATTLSARLCALLGGTFFQDIPRPQRLPLENQTLQKREGYRDFLRVWLLLDQAARLEWDGRTDVFNATVRNVATLYEYWLFFEMLEVLRGIPEMREIRWNGGSAGTLPVFCEQEGRMKINLQRGRTSLLILEYGPPDAPPLRVHFYFDRSYSPTRPGEVLASGAYSRPFRPDFSLAIFPSTYVENRGPAEAERTAEETGRIAHLHFDAKYRVDDINAVFGRNEESVLDEEECEKATNTYKRADLFKMHAYNDAIRRTVGSYVLYPGTGLAGRPFQKYHEILPGVGAFSISPGNPGRRGPLSTFITDVVRQQIDRFTQIARISYWTHDTIREEAVQYYGSGIAEHSRPPKDTNVVLGFVREGDDPETYRRKGVFYCHAVEWEDASRPVSERQPGRATRLGFDPLRADWLGLFQNKVSAPWLARVRDVRIVTAAERAEKLNRAVDEMRAAYYYRFLLGDSSGEPPRDVGPIVGSRLGWPVACTLAELARCHPVTKGQATAFAFRTDTFS